ncbi:MAG: tyrosine-protein phosphatase [Anaerolineae bacterium]|nr:tyrosine-protein phosphatase [Anaerolineae bacterium]
MMLGWLLKLEKPAAYKANSAEVASDVMFEVRRREIYVVRRNTDGNLVVHWNGPQDPVMLYTGDSLETADLQVTTDVEPEHHKVTIIGVDGARRHFVTLVLRGGDKIVVGERILPLEGAHNFRDLGGYETVDGRRVKWGKLYRSDHLGGLTRTDQRYLETLGIRQVYDLRTFAEVNRNPDLLPSSVRYAHFPIFADDPIDKSAILLRRNHLHSVMFDMYRTGLDKGRETYARLFGQLAEYKNMPAVFHCSAGKDRAGLMSALVLLALDVQIETVIDDYSLTNLCAEHLISSTRKEIARYKPFGLTIKHFYPLLAAPPKLMRKTLQYLTDKYDTVENYLCGKGWLTKGQIEQLRDNLLE